VRGTWPAIVVRRLSIVFSSCRGPEMPTAKKRRLTAPAEHWPGNDDTQLLIELQYSTSV
jgi:hypothetical protein